MPQLSPPSPRRKRHRRKSPTNPSAKASSAAGSSPGQSPDILSGAPEAAPAPVATPGTSPVDRGELARIADEIRATGAGPVVAAVTDAEADDAEDALIDRAEKVVQGDGQQLADFDAQDFADMYQLGFGLRADVAGKHWELNDKQALRLGGWTKKVIDKHGLTAAMKYAPEVFAVLLLGYEIGKRMRIDRILAAEKKKAAS